jgi:hypothetical protein
MCRIISKYLADRSASVYNQQAIAVKAPLANSELNLSLAEGRHMCVQYCTASLHSSGTEQAAALLTTPVPQSTSSTASSLNTNPANVAAQVNTACSVRNAHRTCTRDRWRLALVVHKYTHHTQ